MKKFLFWLITIIAITMSTISGWLLMKLFVFLGVNFMTIDGVVGCYFFSILFWIAVWFFTLLKIEDKF